MLPLLTCLRQTFLFLFMWTARSNVGWVFRLVNRRRRSTGLLPALNLSGLQPLLLPSAHQSLLNGQKSFPSRPRFVPLVYFAVYVRLHQWKRKQAEFLFSSKALLASLLHLHFLLLRTVCLFSVFSYIFQSLIVFSPCISFLIFLTFIDYSFGFFSFQMFSHCIFFDIYRCRSIQ